MVYLSRRGRKAFLFANKAVLLTETLAPRQKWQPQAGLLCRGAKMPYKDHEKLLEYQRKYRKNNREKLLEAGRNWYKDNKEKATQKLKEWRKNNADKVKEQHERYYKKNREKIIRRTMRYAQNNREKVNENNRKWNARNPEKIKEKNKKWVLSHPEEVSQNKRKWATKNPDRIRNSTIKKYNITIETYNEIFSLQNGVCAICGSDNNGNSLFVDHCHKTNKTRGLLCRKCNSGIGMLKDDIHLLENAVAYLRKHET